MEYSAFSLVSLYLALLTDEETASLPLWTAIHVRGKAFTASNELSIRKTMPHRIM
jgi:hypothetical protein